jgi:hypothetical protein
MMHWTPEVTGMDSVNPLRRGFLVGGILAICAVVSDANYVLANRAAGSPSMSSSERVYLWLTISTLAVGYLAGIVAAFREPTRRLGMGMLLGLTLTFPVTWLLVAVMMWGGT